MDRKSFRMRKLARTDEHLALRLEEGDDFFPVLKAILVAEEITTAVLLAAAGMMRDAEIGWNGGGTYLRQTFGEPLEILGLSGTVSRKPNGDPFFHAHATLGDSQHRAWGGHLFRAVVHETCELVFSLPKGMIFYRMPLRADELPRFCPERSGSF